jgi:hypothetical protein
VKLGTPLAVAAMALVLAVAASPDVPVLSWHPAAGGVLAGLAVLFVVSLVDRRAPRRLVALGAACLTLALGYDSVRGEKGEITLGPGQGTRTFDEVGPGGRALGLHPLGTALAFEDLQPDGAVTLADQDASRRIRVSPARAQTVSGYRIGDPRRVPSGGTRLLVRVADGVASEATMREGETARIADLDVTVEQYFPDFALENNQPFSRSDEPRNPAALLRVQRGASSWRAFVIRAMPGIHRPEGLDRTLTLVDIVPDEAARLSVSREPAALLAALGVLVAAVGVAWSRW